MSAEQTKTDLDDLYDDVVGALELFKNSAENKDDDTFKKAKNYLEWIHKKTEIVSAEDEFVIPKEKIPFIKRSYVHWIEFGFNIGKELGGRHPAVILKDTGDSVFVLPLSSGKIPADKKNKPYCVEIPHVFDLANIPRWGNVYRVVCVSKMRIDFNSRHGRLQGKYMDKVNKAMDNTGLKFF